MGIAKIIGIRLIAAGTLGLIYGGFTYTKETHSAKLGPVVLQPGALGDAVSGQKRRRMPM